MGSAELWHAVHMCNEAMVRNFISTSRCNAMMRDASCHSVMWHAIAFQHFGIANLMLDSFPCDKPYGVDVTEIHPRRGDTMLHLLCQSKNFDVHAANLFKRIISAAPPGLFEVVNNNGLTFFQVAATSLNFWVLNYVMHNFPAQAKILVCIPKNAALKNMAAVIPQPKAHVYVPPVPFPDHFRIAETLQQDSHGMVPYADVAFDVGPDNGGPVEGRFLAHRVVVAAQSPVLMEELLRLPLELLPRERVEAAIIRVDPQISKEVWRSCIQFMYTGVVSFPQLGNVQQVIELLRAAALYKLPKPLLDFAQSCLYPLLPVSPPTAALQVFSICAGSMAADLELSAAREAATYILLRSAHKLLNEFAPQEACQILTRVLHTVESSVFHSRSKPDASKK